MEKYCCFWFFDGKFRLFWLKLRLSHRSAFEFQPTTTGQIFLTTTYTKKVYLPGITLQFLEGQPPIDGDNEFSGKLFVSQRAHEFSSYVHDENMENMQKYLSSCNAFIDDADVILKIV